jgi:hypothetical protein
MDNLQAAEAGGDAMLGSLQVSMAAPQCSWWAADVLHVLDVFQFQANGGQRRRPVAKGKGAWRATGKEEQGELLPAGEELSELLGQRNSCDF